MAKIKSEVDIGLSPEIRNQIQEVEGFQDDLFEEDIHESIELGEELKKEVKTEKVESKVGDAESKVEFNENGFDEKGFNADGETFDGRKAEDFKEGFDKDGYDAFGYNAEGKDKDGKEKITPIEESLKEQPSNEDNVVDFESVIKGEKDINIKTAEGEIPLKEILETWKNDTDWKKSNTEKAQLVAEERKKLESERKEFDNSNLEVSKILKVIDNEDFLNASDDMFDGDNPVRTLIETVKKSEESVANRTETEKVKQLEYDAEAEKLIQTQIAAIIADDKEYERMPKMQELYSLANELRVTLPVAYDLTKAKNTQAKLTEIEKTHKVVVEKISKELEKIKAELKERNEEVVNLKANPMREEPDDERLDAKSADKEVDNTPVKGFEGARKKIERLWGIKPLE